MQKLKKYLKSNLLKFHSQDYCFFLSLPSKFQFKGQILTKNNVKYLKINTIIHLSKIKFPLKIYFFSTVKTLNTELIKHQKSIDLIKKSIIIIKINNLIFTNKYSHFALSSNFKTNFNSFKNILISTFHLIITLQLNLSNKRLNTKSI